MNGQLDWAAGGEQANDCGPCRSQPAQRGIAKWGVCSSVAALADGIRGIPAQEIGTVTERRAGMKIRTRAGLIDLPRFERDELARFFDSRSD